MMIIKTIDKYTNELLSTKVITNVQAHQNKYGIWEITSDEYKYPIYADKKDEQGFIIFEEDVPF